MCWGGLLLNLNLITINARQSDTHTPKCARNCSVYGYLIVSELEFCVFIFAIAVVGAVVVAAVVYVSFGSFTIVFHNVAKLQTNTLERTVSTVVIDDERKNHSIDFSIDNFASD